MLRPGTPIDNASQDKLGRARFSSALASAIAAYDEPSSLVVGLYGSWGTGKTSLLNMLESDLRPFSDRLLLVRFNPWSYSDQTALLQHLLSELSVRLETAGDGNLKSAGKFLDDLTTIISPFAQFIPYGDVAKNIVKGVGSLVSQRAKELGSLQGVKSKISEALVASAKRVVVIVDDIDRLTSDEIRQIFQLVKSVADFSNVIYVLSFDKKLVVKALADVQKGDGDAYLDKIVNIPFEIPRITQKQMRSLLDAEVAKFSTIDEDYPWQSDRIIRTLNAISRKFDTIRALDRFSNVLEFTASLIKGEVDYSDFMALTALQISDPAIFDFIRENTALLILEAEDSEDNEAEQREDVWKRMVAAARTPASIHVASMVFPDPTAEGSEDDDAEGLDLDRATAIRDARACASVMILERYFQLVVPEDDVPRTHMRELLAATDNYARTDELVQRLRRQVGLRSTFSRLADSDLSRLDAKRMHTLLYAVLKLFMTDDPSARRLPHTFTSRHIKLLLRRIHDDEERFHVLVALLKSDVGTTIPLLRTITDLPRDIAGPLISRRDPPLVDPDKAYALSKLAASKISTALRSESPPPWLLIDYVRVLELWRLAGGLSDVRAYVKNILDERRYFLIGLLITTRGVAQKGSTADAARAIDDFVDADLLITTIANLLGEPSEVIRLASPTQINTALQEASRSRFPD